MTVFEAGLAIASGTGPTFDAIRAMIGEDQLALSIAKSFAEAAGIALSATTVARTMGVARNTAIKAIECTETIISQK
jgi:hypothetical protein